MAAPASSRTRDVYIGNFKRLDSIGQGSFAVVYKAVHPDDKSLVAIKTVQHAQLKGKLKQNLFSEIRIMQEIHHPHIVALISILESTNHIHLVMEFCQFGDLATFVRKRDKLDTHPVTADMIRRYPNSPNAGFHEVVIRHFAQQLVSALKFLRDANLVHRDLKPQNLLLNPPPAQLATEKPENRPHEVNKDSFMPVAGLATLPFLKIADFGFARHLPTTTMAETLCGSPLYMAPEILRYEKYDAKADLWSVGTVLYELCVGKPPFRAANHVELLRKIEKTMDNIKFPEGAAISDEMKSLVRSLLKKMPSERLSWDSLFNSKIITDEIPGLVEPDISARQAAALQLKPTSPTTTTTTESERPLLSRHLSEDQSPRRESSESPPKPSARPSQPRTVTSPQMSTAPRHSSHEPSTQTRPRRPSLLSHVTAPASHAVATAAAPTTERPTTSPTSAEPARRKSLQPPSPSIATPKDTPLKSSPRTQERVLRETRERAAQDVAFERDYVMVEKRAVEVNAFADELAASPAITPALHNGPSSAPTNMIRRNPSSGTTHTRANQPALHSRNPSYERRYGPSRTSPASALAAALNMVNARLYGGPFGGPFSPPLGKGPSPPQGYGPYPAFPSTPAGPLVLGDASKPLAMDEDHRVLSTMEDSATRSDVVYGFAEVKYKQLIPVAPSNDNSLGIRRAGATAAAAQETVDEDDDLTVDAIVAIAEEALVLYVKALAILSNTINLAGNWWGHRTSGGAGAGAGTRDVEVSGSPKSLDSGRSALAHVGHRVNNVVQWARNRFNECLEKSEYVSRRLVDAQARLPEGHPSRPRSRRASSSASGGAAPTGKSGSGPDITISSGVTAEKLMYDRALDMSRTAAVNELVGEDLSGCEVSYLTAIRLLEAVLENDDEPASSSSKGAGSASSKDRKSATATATAQASSEDAAAVLGIDEADRKTVLKLIESMRTRLTTLRKKIAMQSAAAAARRTHSTGSVPKTGGSGAVSARASPR